MNEGNRKPMNMGDAIKNLRNMRKAAGIIVKEPHHIEALQMGLHAMIEQGGKDMYIRMLRYHVKKEGAMIFPDSLTKAALEAAENAITRMQVEGVNKDATE